MAFARCVQGPSGGPVRGEVLERNRPERLVLEVRFRPTGVATVTIEVEPEGTSRSTLTIEEHPERGPITRLPRFVTDPLLTLRNALALQRLRHEVERSSSHADDPVCSGGSDESTGSSEAPRSYEAFSPDGPPFSARVTQENSRLVVAVAGELDLCTTPGFRREVVSRFTGPFEAVAIDLECLAFVDSSGLHALDAIRVAAAEHDVRLQLLRVPVQARRTLEISGMVHLFDLVPLVSVPTEG